MYTINENNMKHHNASANKILDQNVMDEGVNEINQYWKK